MITDDVLAALNDKLGNKEGTSKINQFILANEPRLSKWASEWASRQLNSIGLALPDNIAQHLRNLLLSNVVIGYMMATIAHSKMYGSDLDLDTNSMLFNGDSSKIIGAWKNGRLDPKYYDEEYIKSLGVSTNDLGTDWAEAVKNHDNREKEVTKDTAELVLASHISDNGKDSDNEELLQKITI